MKVLTISVFMILSLFCNAQIKTMEARLLSVSGFPPSKLESFPIFYKPKKFLMLGVFKFNFESHSQSVDSNKTTKVYNYYSKGFYGEYGVIIVIEKKTNKITDVTLFNEKVTLNYTSGEYKT